DVDSGLLFDLVKAYRAATKSCPPVPPSTEVRERALRMLAESQPALDLIDRAARNEACHYAFNLETGEFPPFHPFRTAGGLLSLGDLDEALRRAEAPDLLKRTIEGERVWGMNQLAAILGPDWPEGELQSASAKRRPFWERRGLLRQASDYVAVTAAMTHAAGEPWPQVFGAMPAAFRIPKIFSPDMSADLASSLPMERAGQALAATRAGRVAIAVERYRRRQGTLPAS